MTDCEQPTRTPTKLRSRQFQRFILSRLTVGAQNRHGNRPFLRLTAEFERSEKPATSSGTYDPEFATGRTTVSHPQQTSEQLPPHLNERLQSSYGEAAWNDRHGRNPA